MPSRTRTDAVQAPHSWSFATWPATVFPHSETKARNLVKRYLVELLRAGAVSRVGHKLVFRGAGYDRWLQSHQADVGGYTCNANNREAAPAA